MPKRLQTTKARAVGTRQTLKALQDDRVQVVFVARDAERRVTAPVEELSRRRGTEVVYVDNMEQLGKYCEINVGAAAAALLRGGSPR